jgi:hypothetical protein
VTVVPALTVSVAGSNEKFAMTISFGFVLAVLVAGAACIFMCDWCDATATAQMASVSINANLSLDLLSIFPTSKFRFLSVQTRQIGRYSPSNDGNNRDREEVFLL